MPKLHLTHIQSFLVSVAGTVALTAACVFAAAGSVRAVAAVPVLF